MINIPHFEYWEHFQSDENALELNALDWSRITDKAFFHDTNMYCFKKIGHGKSFKLKTDYFIGVDWLIENQATLYIAPKVNTRKKPDFDKGMDEYDHVRPGVEKNQQEDIRELNYLEMLTKCMDEDLASENLAELIHIDWKAKEIIISQKEDLLSPFLVVCFLNLLKKIVRKGLKKSYYTVTENLEGRIKGKILMGKHLKDNIYKNRFSKVACCYQQFGTDSQENRFLKRVMLFCSDYVDTHREIFGNSFENIIHSLNYCKPAFATISGDSPEKSVPKEKKNLFFLEYTDALKIGSLILRRFGYNISQTGKEMVEMIATPPFWIDMPKLFERFVYTKLLKQFPGKKEVQFQFTTYGNALDFLLNTSDSKMVVDAKYKLAYTDSHIHQDIRQISGYARLNKVYDTLGIDRKQIIDCLIIYPDFSKSEELNWNEMEVVKFYNGVFKLGIRLPLISTED